MKGKVLYLGAIPIKIYLFGSAAKNKMITASDIDICVIISDEDKLKLAKKKYYCSVRKHRFPVDCIFLTKAFHLKNSFVGGLSMVCYDEGLVLYKKE